MYLGAQRVIGDGDDRPVTTYLYLHGGALPSRQQAMLSDIRWVSQLAPGQLARERHEGGTGGRRVVSYLEVSGPDDTDPPSLAKVLDELARQVAAGYKAPVKHEKWGAEFFRGAEVDQDPEQEFTELRVRLETFFADGGTTPPARELTVLVSRDRDETCFEWDQASRERMTAAARHWTPYRVTVSDDVRDSFQQQHGALYPHILDVIRPHGVDLAALGGVAFKVADGTVLWFSSLE